MRFVLRFFGFLFSIGAIAFLIARGGRGYFYWIFSKDLPDHAQLANYEPPVMTRVHAGDGSLSPNMPANGGSTADPGGAQAGRSSAFLSAEDKNFYKHEGIDPEGIVRASSRTSQRGKRSRAPRRSPSRWPRTSCSRTSGP